MLLIRVGLYMSLIPYSKISSGPPVVLMKTMSDSSEATTLHLAKALDSCGKGIWAMSSWVKAVISKRMRELTFWMINKFLSRGGRIVSTG